jgi:myo-inositol-1(or 4)-monophosphatase
MARGDFRPETVAAIDAVEQALEMTYGRVGAEDISHKGVRDLVTATDVAVEDAVRASVREALDLPVVGEEAGGDDPRGPSPYWLVDPICGTRNFASGIPLYCVNVALVEDEQVVLAVVGDPTTGEIHVAERGRGAWALNDHGPRALTTSDESGTIVVEDSHAEADRRERAAQMAANAIRADRWELRAFSTTLSLVYVAAGRVAAYVLFWTSAIHAGAGSLLAAEAGATVTDIDGNPWTIQSDSIVASATPALHHELLLLAGTPQTESSSSTAGTNAPTTAATDAARTSSAPSSPAS